MATHNENLDNLIIQAIKATELEAENVMPNLEDAWKDFEEKLKIKCKKHNNNKIFNKSIALIAGFILVILAFSQNSVVAFKNEIFKWIGKDSKNNTIIVEQKNPQVEEGIYTNLTLTEAQEKVLFHIVTPAFLPKGLDDTPSIEVTTYEYPYAIVIQTYQGEGGKVLVIGQDSSPVKEQKNTFIPENTNIKRMNIKDNDVILVEKNRSYYAWWEENGINYTINAIDISMNDVIRVIENLH